jgi:hypothetical protein
MVYAGDTDLSLTMIMGNDAGESSEEGEKSCASCKLRI